MTNDEEKNEEQDKNLPEQVLLTEYQACQSEAHYNGTTCWTIIGIFLSFITAVAALLIKNVMEANNELLNNNSNERWVILGLSLLAIAIIILLGLWLKRANIFIKAANNRMLTISNQLDMHLNKMMEETKNRGTPLKGHCIAILLFILVSIPWVFLATISASKYVKDLL